MQDERFRQIMAQVGYPDSRGILGALQQVANEVEQEVIGKVESATSKVLSENAALKAENERLCKLNGEAVDTLKEVHAVNLELRSNNAALKKEIEDLKVKRSELTKDEKFEREWRGRLGTENAALKAEIREIDTALRNGISGTLVSNYPKQTAEFTVKEYAALKARLASVVEIIQNVVDKQTFSDGKVDMSAGELMDDIKKAFASIEKEETGS